MPLEQTNIPSSDNNDFENTSYIRRPKHETMLRQLYGVPACEISAFINIQDHKSQGYIDTEVLVTLARAGYGETSQVRNAIGKALLSRIVKGLSTFLRMNPEWLSVVNRDSESRKEIIQTVAMAIFANNAEISFAEVAFWEFINMRFLDWFKSQLSLKNSAISADSINPVNDEDGGRLSLVDQIPDEDAMSVEEAVSLKQLIGRLELNVLSLPRKERNAIYYCYECEFTQEEASKLMGCTERSVRTYLKSALVRLRDGEGKK